MKLLKKLLIGLIALVALLMLIAAFLPKTFLVEKDVVINKPAGEVFNYVKLVKNQDNYGVWNLADPNMKKTYEGTDGSVGFKYAWDSEKMGKGTQEISKIEDGKRIETILNFGFGEPATSHMIIDSVSANQTKVTWGISGNSPWPMNIMNYVFSMDGDFDQGLANLKKELENK